MAGRWAGPFQASYFLSWSLTKVVSFSLALKSLCLYSNPGSAFSSHVVLCLTCNFSVSVSLPENNMDDTVLPSYLFEFL